METLEFIGLVMVFSMVYSMTEKWHDTKFIKPRAIYVKHFDVFSKTEIKTCNQCHKMLHNIDVFVKGLFAGVIAALYLVSRNNLEIFQEAFKNGLFNGTWEGLRILAIMLLSASLLLTINWCFDIILNILMGWKILHRGPGFFDKIKFEIRFCILGGILMSLLLLT